MVGQPEQHVEKVGYQALRISARHGPSSKPGPSDGPAFLSWAGAGGPPSTGWTVMSWGWRYISDRWAGTGGPLVQREPLVYRYRRCTALGWAGTGGAVANSDRTFRLRASIPLRAATSTSPGFPATLTSGNGRVRYREVRFRESRKNDSEKRHATVDNLGGPVSGGQGMMRSRNDDGLP